MCNELFIKSGAADCGALEKIYTSKVEENKTNLEYLNGVLKVLTFFECDKSDIYYTASDYAYQINKTPDAAIGKAQKLYKDGKVRAIGVSNFLIHHLEDLIATAEIKPMVNQVEFHPHLTLEDLRAYCKKEGIQLEAWSPLKRGALLDNPVLKEIAEKHNKSIAQVILRWDLQHGVVTIPKSVKEHRIIENSQIFDFVLSTEEMNRIDQLNEDSRSGSHPDEMTLGFED